MTEQVEVAKKTCPRCESSRRTQRNILTSGESKGKRCVHFWHFGDEPTVEEKAAPSTTSPKLSFCPWEQCKANGACQFPQECSANDVYIEHLESQLRPQPDSSSITDEMPKPVEIVGNHWIHRERDDDDAKFYRRDEIEEWLKGVR